MFENVLGKLEAPSRCMVSMYKNINITNEQDNNNDDKNEKIINEMTTGNLKIMVMGSFSVAAKR